MALDLKRLINSPVDSNCYIIFDREVTDECIVVDPGSESNKMLITEINALQLKPRYIILTHEHYDHCWGVNDLRAKYKELKLICSRICSDAIQESRANYSHYLCKPGFSISPSDIFLEDINWHFDWNNQQLSFVPAQGHSSAGIFICVGKAIFTGDTVIKDVETITKFKTGSQKELEKSIKYLESFKGGGYLVYPGHGEPFFLDDYDLSKALRIVRN